MLLAWSRPQQAGACPAEGDSRATVRGLRRFALRFFLASVVLNAALAIGVLLAGDFGETEGKILLTTLCVTGAALLAFACEAARGRGRLGFVPPAGAVASVTGFALLIIGIWTSAEDDLLSQLVGTFLVPAVAAALVSLVSLATLAPRFRWVFTAFVAVTGVLGAMILSLIWGEWESEWFSRALGVVAVALAALAVVVPVLHRQSARELAEAPAPGTGVSYCPRCGRRLVAAADEETACPSCGARFAVRFSPT